MSTGALCQWFEKTSMVSNKGRVSVKVRMELVGKEVAQCGGIRLTFVRKS